MIRSATPAMSPPSGPPESESVPAPSEPTPWALGLIVAVACAAFVACLLIGVAELLGGIAWWMGVGAMAIVIVGLAWVLWDLRLRPVWRWIVAGTYVGLLTGTCASVVLMVAGVVSG